MGPFDQCVARFGAAAQAAAVYELRIRMLADKVTALRSMALARNLEDVEKAVCVHFASVLTAADLALLESTRRVRNKLLHCEFWTARERLVTAGRQPTRGGVQLGIFDTGEVKELEELRPDEPRLFGWVLDGATSEGLFETAKHVFHEAIVLARRLVIAADYPPFYPNYLPRPGKS